MEENGVGRTGSVSSRPPLSPTDSCVSIGAFRPSLVWLFNHIRQEDRECLVKDDLRLLLGTTVDSAQLDEAFENLDMDKDGEISLDEFLAGFAKFWKEAPHTPGYEHLRRFSLPPQVEEHFESSDSAPSVKVQESLAALSSHNRHSIEHLWRSLSENNPELLNDFEDFVSEVACEVQVAQQALDNQRRAIKKEADELDEEMESRLNDAHTTLQIKTNLVREQVRTKLEHRLADKEGELLFVRSQLDELEEEVVDTQRRHTELQDQIQMLNQEKVELNERLVESEKKLQESQSTVATIKGKALLEVEAQQQQLYTHEEELLKQKSDYEESIAKLKEQLATYVQQPVKTVLPSNQVTPDLLATSMPREVSSGSLRDEIVQQEGMASPLLRKEQVLEPSPFRERTRSSVRSRPLKQETKTLQQQSALTMSLPNLADIDDMGQLATSKQPVYIPVYVGSKHEEQPVDEPSSPVQIHITPTEEPRDGHVTPTDGHVTPPDVTPPDGHLVPEKNRSHSIESDGSSLPSIPDHPLQSLREQEWEKHCQPIEFIQALKDTPDYVFKILVVGDSFVGKSSYLHRMCNNAFSQHYSSTVGVDFHSKALQTEDKKVVSLQLWDTAGQERYQSVTKTYYRGAQGVILMYDISQEESFLSVKSWINSIHNNTGGSPPAAMILVGNKIDLEESGEREVLTETGENFAKMYGAEFIETSAKTGYNVANSLLMLVRAVKDQIDEQRNPSKDSKNVEQFVREETIQLSPKKATKSDGCSLCSR